MVLSRFFLLGVAACALAAPAGATVVTSIKIMNANQDYLQISEVVAIDSVSGADVALASNGATAYSPAVGYGTTTDAAIDGIGPAAYPAIFHGSSGAGEYLLVTLAQAYDLSSLTIDGRADEYGSRDLYSYELYSGATIVGSGTLDARNATHAATATLASAGAPAAVPEPATWATMVAGFGLVGGSIRRRRTIARLA